MKKILLFLSLLFTLGSVFAQHPVGIDSFALQTLGSTNTFVKSKGPIGGDYGLINAHFADTATANLYKIKNYPGAQIMVGELVYIRNLFATGWNLIVGSSIVITDSTIIYTDTTLDVTDTTTHPGYQTLKVSQWTKDRIFSYPVDTASGIPDGFVPSFDSAAQKVIWRAQTTYPATPTPSLDDVTTVGNATNNGISAGNISSGSVVLDGNLSVYHDGFKTNIVPFNSTHDNVINPPDSSGVPVLRVKVNGTTFNGDNKGLADLGTITGAATDTSLLKHKVDSTNSITGYTTLYQNGLKQNVLNGTGFVKSTAGTISYDNSTYLTTVDTTNISNFSTKVRSLFSSTAPITYVNGLIGITQATTSTNGYLSSTDWNTFNGKQAAGSYLTTETDPIVKAINGIIKSNGTTISAAVANTDYQYPISLTTTGSGAATLISNILNVPTPTSGGASSSDSLTQIGTVYYKKSWANLNDFTDVGTSATISGTDINITGGTNIYTEFLAVKDTTLYQDWKMKIRFKVNAAPSGTTYGIGIGFETGLAGLSSIVKADLSTGGSAGLLTLANQAGTAFTGIATNGTAITFIQNDTLELTLEKDGKYLTGTVSNLNNSTKTYSASYIYDISSGSPSLPTTGRFSIIRFGGNYNITSINITSNERKYATFAFLGPSITQVNKASEFYKSYAGLTDNYLKNSGIQIKTTINFGGGSDKTTETLARIPVIIASKPKIVFLSIGSNDIRAGTTVAATMVNYRSIVSQLTSAGITVWNLLPFPENGLNLTALKDSILANYPTTYIDTWNPLRTGTGLNVTYDAGDGIHPNDAGHLVIFRTILKTGLLDLYMPFKAKTDVDVPIGLGGGGIATNLAISVQSLFGNLTGIQNTAVGYQVLKSNTANYNTGVGYHALFTNTTGTQNAAFGVNSLQANTSGTLNAAFGTSSLYNNTTGSSNTATGQQALFANTTGSNNTASGYLALTANVGAGVENTAMGSNALAANTSGTDNVAIGFNAMLQSTTTTYNTAVGVTALGQAITTGGSNSAFGSSGLRSTTSGANNTSAGVLALYQNSTGSNNLGLGYFAGAFNTTRSDQIFINTQSRTNYAGDTTASPIYIQQNATVASQKISLNGIVGISTTNPNSTLHTTGSFSAGYVEKTANYTATINDYTINCTANTFQVTLPTAIGIKGRIYVITNSDAAATITVGTTSSQTFKNVTATPTSITIVGLGAVEVQSTDAGWLQLK